MDQRANRVPLASLQRGQQLPREILRVNAVVRLGDELKLSPDPAREVTLPDQSKDVCHQEFPVPTGRLVGGQDPVVNPCLTVETPTPRARATSAVLRYRGSCIRFRLCRVMADSDVTRPMVSISRGRINRDPKKHLMCRDPVIEQAVRARARFVTEKIRSYP